MSGVIFRNGTPYPGAGGTSFTQRANLKFEGAEVADDSTNDATVVTVDNLSNQDMQDIKDAFNPAGAAPLRMFNYSTDEQVVGTWIDGKPLYQKTIVDEGTFVSGNNIRTHGIANIETVVNIDAMLLQSANYFTKLDHGEEVSSSQAFMEKFTTTEYNIWLGSSVVTYRPVSKALITVKYTKTTD